MALSSFLDSFNVTTGAVGTTYARSGYGFQPKAFIVWANKETGSTDTVAAGNAGISFGLGTSTSSRYVMACQTEDNVTTSSCDRGQRSDAIVYILTNTGAIDGLLDISSVDSDGITFIVDDVFTTTYRVFVLALGGDDITNVFTGETTMTGTGSLNITGPGFQPDMAVCVCTRNTSTTPSATTQANLSIGIAAGATPANASFEVHSVDAQGTSNTYGYGRSGDWYTTFVTTTDNGRGNISAWLSTGFTVTYSTNPSATHRIFYLAIKGGNWAVKTGTTQTDTTTDISLSSVGFTSVGGLVLSACRAESTAGTPSDHAEMSIGAFVGTSSEAATGYWDEDNAAAIEPAIGQENDACYLNISSSDALEGNMNVTAIGSDSVTLRMGDADPSGNFFAALLFGSTAGGGGGEYTQYISLMGCGTK